MNCQDFEITILSMARAQLLEASARRQALAHIAQCPACADMLAEQQALTAAVRTTAKSIRDEAASAQVEQSLRAAFRQQMGSAPALSCGGSYRGIARIRTWQWSQPALVAVAAALLIVLLAGTIWRWSFTDRRQKTATVQPAPATPKENEKLPERLSPAGPAEHETVRHIAGERRRARKPAQRSATSGEELTTEFIALANEGELVPLESGRVLRVELSASTLISMGLPITTEDVSKPLLADLLVGQDGMARAIRFVRPGEAADLSSLQHLTNK
jgi:hypothetical protein